ncbi:serine/threonine protein kinase [Stappia sp. F7233]|uniref:Serine/threonine protein kinase n=1 Tax=Stappia albiluteola TaxID=2758565 RepID=A0A839AC13_9HYPH|nr:serine/threonine protein kinase [Stappia albiluteola]MBA5776981.1 serine/threonine protein kinase [Stappia albiluteola]
MTAGTLHASCVVIAGSGILIRGASGSGKSSLGEELVARAKAQGHFAAYVADDRVIAGKSHGRLIAEAPSPLAGLWERRGAGIVRVQGEARAVLRLVIDILPIAEIERLPEEDVPIAEISGIGLPLIRVPMGEISLAATRALSRVFEDTHAVIGG